jgi:hypothetical protein
MVAVIHSSGGPAPYTAWLGVYPNREVAFRSARGRLSRRKIDEARFQRMQALLSSAELRAELESLTTRSESFSDREEVAFLIKDKEYRFVCREVNPQSAVLALLREIRSLGRFRLEDRPFVGPDCTNEMLK